MNQELEQRQIEEFKKQVLGRILTKEAYERLARIRIVNPNLSNQIELYLLQIYQTGKIKEQISDDKLKNILELLSKKREISIKRR